MKCKTNISAQIRDWSDTMVCFVTAFFKRDFFSVASILDLQTQLDSHLSINPKCKGQQFSLRDPILSLVNSSRKATEQNSSTQKLINYSVVNENKVNIDSLTDHKSILPAFRTNRLRECWVHSMQWYQEHFTTFSAARFANPYQVQVFRQEYIS